LTGFPHLFLGMPLSKARVTSADRLPDDELIKGCRLRDEAAVRALTGRYNRRLFRIARSVLRDDAEAEDVVQETYVRAFAALDDFRGDASAGTWLSRIALNEALGRLRRRRPSVEWTADAEAGLQPRILQFPQASMRHDPEHVLVQREMQTVLQEAIDRLPDDFRAVFVARAVEGMTIEETAALLDLRPETVKTRLFRARRRLRADLERRIGSEIGQVFPFDGARCERMTGIVVERLCRADTPSDGGPA
jgi:RNA polymerase sigma-70 factor (ECF subfamily)